MAPVVVVGGHQKATGGDGGHALACGMVESSVVTPQRPWHAITGGGERGIRPGSPVAGRLVGSHSMNESMQ